MASLLKQTYTVVRGGQRVRKKTSKWYGQYRDANGKMRRVPLSTDKDAARAELNRLVRQAERERAGFADPSERRAQEPIQTHIRDYQAYLISKSVSPSHLKQVMSRL